MLTSRLHKGFIGALHNALCSNINPGPGRHLTIHGQPLFIEFVKMVPCGPMGHQIGIGNQHARGVFVSFKHAHRFSRLHQKSLVLLERFEAVNDRIKILPAARRASNAAINHQFMGIFRHAGMKIVH